MRLRASFARVRGDRGIGGEAPLSCGPAGADGIPVSDARVGMVTRSLRVDPTGADLRRMGDSASSMREMASEVSSLGAGAGAEMGSLIRWIRDPAGSDTSTSDDTAGFDPFDIELHPWALLQSSSDPATSPSSIDLRRASRCAARRGDSSRLLVGGEPPRPLEETLVTTLPWGLLDPLGEVVKIGTSSRFTRAEIFFKDVPSRDPRLPRRSRGTAAAVLWAR
mmetsp:Transcript_58838/g.187829  ORF Transcript_58838/g.187829 Transcript_58838/m.187829 type:complete len:222 (+) Transcript_58838:1105-1770(+)